MYAKGWHDDAPHEGGDSGEYKGDWAPYQEANTKRNDLSADHANFRRWAIHSKDRSNGVPR